MAFRCKSKRGFKYWEQNPPNSIREVWVSFFNLSSVSILQFLLLHSQNTCSFCAFQTSSLCFAFVYKNKTRFKKLINHIEHPSIDRCKRLTFSWSYRMSFLYENDFFFSHFPTPSVCCAVILRHRVSVGAHRRVEFVIIWSSNIQRD